MAGNSELALVTGSEDVKSGDLYQSPHYYPMDTVNTTSWMPFREPYAKHAYYFCPADNWIPNARLFGQVKSDEKAFTGLHRKLRGAFCYVCSSTRFADDMQVANPISKVDGRQNYKPPRYLITVTSVPDERLTKDSPVGYLFHLAYTEVRLTDDEADDDQKWDFHAKRFPTRETTQGPGGGEYDPTDMQYFAPDDTQFKLVFPVQREDGKWTKGDGKREIRYKLQQIDERRTRRRPDWILAKWLDENTQDVAVERKKALRARQQQNSRAKKAAKAVGLLDPLTKFDWCVVAAQYTGANQVCDILPCDLRYADRNTPMLTAKRAGTPVCDNLKIH